MGAVCAILVGYTLDYALSSLGAWRWMLGLATIPAGILLLGLISLPDTPRWLIWRGQLDDARRVLQRVLEHENVSAELEELQHAIKQPTGGWADLLAPEIR